MGHFGLLLFAAALTVGPDGATLRSGCDTRDEELARIEAGTAVEIRFAMAGGSETCYKVSAISAGRPVQGYVPAGALTGLDRFEKERTAAPTINVATLPAPPPTGSSAAPDHPLAKASKLLESKQPRAALELAESSMQVHGRDYYSLLIGGVAAYQSDDLPRSLEYLRQAQQLKNDRLIEQWIAKIEKESGNDRSAEKLFGTRFLLRYEGGKLDNETARTMIGTLEQEFSRISAQLGCRTDERIVTVVQSREAYFASTGASAWSGGHFDGKIRVPITDGTVTPQLRRAFAHELVHACLAQMGDYPAWLHEGLAQKLSGDRLTGPERVALRAEIRRGQAPKLAQLAGSWARASAAHAETAYAYSLAGVELMLERYRAYGIHNLLRNPERLPGVAAELDTLLMQ